VDNQTSIAISHNPVFHGKTKHFEIKFFFLREVQKEGEVSLFITDLKISSQTFLQNLYQQTSLNFLGKDSEFATPKT